MGVPDDLEGEGLDHLPAFEELLGSRREPPVGQREDEGPGPGGRTLRGAAPLPGLQVDETPAALAQIDDRVLPREPHEDVDTAGEELRRRLLRPAEDDRGLGQPLTDLPVEPTVLPEVGHDPHAGLAELLQDLGEHLGLTRLLAEHVLADLR